MSKLLSSNSHSKKSFIESKKLIHIPLNLNKNDNITALLVPHAGIDYSGSVALNGYAQIAWDRYDRVIILSTNHENKSNYVPESTKFVLDDNNKEFTFDNNLSSVTVKDDETFMSEHSWLTQMPFIDPAENPTKIIITIIVVGNYDENLVKELSEKINSKTLLIVNTDLLHCGGHFIESCPLNVKQYNLETIDIICDLIKNFSDAKLNNFIKILSHDRSCGESHDRLCGESHNRLCGTYAVATFIKIASIKGFICDDENVLYSNSRLKVTFGREIDQSNASVGYASVPFIKKLAVSQRQPDKGVDHH